MNQGKLKTAILGLGERAECLLEAASQSDYFELVAVADKDGRLAEQTGEQYRCASYDDYRQLIIQGGFDCLLVAAGMHSCEQYVKSAIKNKCNILKLAPPARDFEEAAELVRLAEDAKVRFAVANAGRFAGGFVEFQKDVRQADSGQYVLMTAECEVGEHEVAAWQSDAKLAGGGVLLYDCYELIDEIVASFGVPEQVYSVNTSTAGDRQQRLYRSEDTAVVTMVFGEAFVGSLTASRALAGGPENKYIRLHTKDKTLTVTNCGFSAIDRRAKNEEQKEYEPDRLGCMKKVLENFALSILKPDKNELVSSGSENLRNMAVIEAAYLSARTGFPEQPGRILQMARLEAINILERAEGKRKIDI